MHTHYMCCQPVAFRFDSCYREFMDIFVKKKGSVFTVYEGPGGKPMPIVDYATTPAGFPRAFTSQGHLAQAYPGAKFRFVEAQPRVPPPQAQAAYEQMLKPRVTAPQGGEQVALNYFQRLLDRYHWCSDEVRDSVKIQVEATAETLIEIFPEIGEKLEVMKTKEARFKL